MELLTKPAFWICLLSILSGLVPFKKGFFSYAGGIGTMIAIIFALTEGAHLTQITLMAAGYLLALSVNKERTV